jgi:hypothetical protein
MHLLCALHAKNRPKDRTSTEEHTAGDGHGILVAIIFCVYVCVYIYTERYLSWRTFSLNCFIMKRITELREAVLTRC